MRPRASSSSSSIAGDRTAIAWRGKGGGAGWEGAGVGRVRQASAALSPCTFGTGAATRRRAMCSMGLAPWNAAGGELQRRRGGARLVRGVERWDAEHAAAEEGRSSGQMRRAMRRRVAAAAGRRSPGQRRRATGRRACSGGGGAARLCRCGEAKRRPGATVARRARRSGRCPQVRGRRVGRRSCDRVALHREPRQVRGAAVVSAMSTGRPRRGSAGHERFCPAADAAVRG